MPEIGEKKIIKFRYLCVWSGLHWSVICSAPCLTK